jgi:hypothetical protein
MLPERLRGFLEIAALVLYVGSVVITLAVLVWLDAR